MIKPPLLKHGDTVRIVATARKVSQEEINVAITILENWGVKVRYTEELFAENHQFAGDDTVRRTELQAALDDPECKAIFCARGGYGTARILSGIDWSGIKKNPKWVIGFSDITILHSKLYREGLISIHGMMPALFGKENADHSLNKLKDLLFTRPESLIGRASELAKPGKSSGNLVGGNLSMISIAEGTNYSIDGKGNILFLEDLDEYLYHVDRMMVHLKHSGLLSGISGLVVGQMSDMNDNKVPFGKTALEIIHEHIQEFNIPVGYNFSIGHDLPNLPVMHGAPCSLDVNHEGKATLTFD